jgi:hypothetical protein
MDAVPLSEALDAMDAVAEATPAWDLVPGMQTPAAEEPVDAEPPTEAPDQAEGEPRL